MNASVDDGIELEIEQTCQLRERKKKKEREKERKEEREREREIDNEKSENTTKDNLSEQSLRLEIKIRSNNQKFTKKYQINIFKLQCFKHLNCFLCFLLTTVVSALNRFLNFWQGLTLFGIADVFAPLNICKLLKSPAHRMVKKLLKKVFRQNK